MTNLKLTKEQIEALRSIDAELADKLESGKAVTLERAVEKWEPKIGDYCVQGHGAVALQGFFGNYRDYGSCRKTRESAERLSHDQRIFNRLHAYREEFAPGYVVPPFGAMAWCPILCEDGQYRAFGMESRIPTAIYMPYDICEELCRKLNSGEVVL